MECCGNGRLFSNLNKVAVCKQTMLYLVYYWTLYLVSTVVLLNYATPFVFNTNTTINYCREQPYYKHSTITITYNEHSA